MKRQKPNKDDSGIIQVCSELAEIKVSYRRKAASKVKISNSKEAFDVLYPLYDQDLIQYQEQFFLLLLNRANIVLGWVKLSYGGTASTIVDSKVVFAIALKANASSIMLSHNHPSSNLLPSEADIKLTGSIAQAGKLFSIVLLDHIIVSPENEYYSFADQGQICIV